MPHPVDALFTPHAKDIGRSQMVAFERHCSEATGHRFAGPEDLHRFSIEQAERFWRLALGFFRLDVQGTRLPAIAGTDCASARFFPGLRLSFTRNLLRQCEPGDDALDALVAVDESGASRVWTRGELATRVLQVASGLARLGLSPGDRVVAVARNTVESVVACLATLAVGATWSSVAPDLGTDATLDRFGQLAPKLLFAHGGYRYHGIDHDIGDALRTLCGRLGSVAVVVALDDTPVPVAGAVTQTRLSTLATDGAAGPWTTLADLPTFPFDHPAYILFTSGTTGPPKCLVHGAGGTLLEHVKEHRLHADLRPGERLLFQTTTGWMMWNWVVSALASRVTLVLHDGSPTFPSADALWRTVSSARVNVFGTSPAFLRYSHDAAIEPRLFDLGPLRALLSTGSVLADDLFAWAARHVKRVPLHSVSGGTDIVGCFLLGHPCMPVRAGELQCRSLGCDVAAFGPDSRPVEPGVVGELVCRAPFPSRPLGLFGDAGGERFHAAYFARHAGVWAHGDLVEFTPQGAARLHGRCDGVLNIRGVRIGPAEIYRALAAGVPEVAEALAVEQAAACEIGGSRMVLLVMLRAGAGLTRDLEDRIRGELARRCSPVHVPALILARRDLPATHNGKRSERAACDAVNRRRVANLAALRNPESLAGLDVLASLDQAPAHGAGQRPADVDAAQLAALWQEVLRVPAVGVDDPFFLLGGHSLAALTLLGRVERAFGVRLPMSSLLGMAATPAGMAAALRAGGLGPKESHVVAIRAEGHKLPVFWLPGGGGLSVLAFREVSLRLGEGQPVYGFEARPNLADAPASVADMARRYVDDLVAAFPHGPYMLLGFSSGGWVAFEMGMELHRRGQRVALLCLIDSALPRHRGPLARGTILLQRAAYHVRQLLRGMLGRAPGYARGAAAAASLRVRERLTHLGLPMASRATPAAAGPSDFDAVDRHNRAAAARYLRGELPTFRGRVTVVLAECTSQAAVSAALDDRLAIGRHATGGLEVHRVPGAHLGMLQPPEADALAAVLRDCIQRATAVDAAADAQACVAVDATQGGPASARPSRAPGAVQTLATQPEKSGTS